MDTPPAPPDLQIPLHPPPTATAWSDEDYEAAGDCPDPIRALHPQHHQNHHHHHHHHHQNHHHHHPPKRARSISSDIGVGERETRERSSSSVVLAPFNMEQSSDDPYEFHQGSRSSNGGIGGGGGGGGGGNGIQKQSSSNSLKATSSFSGETTMTATESSPAVCSSSSTSKGKGTGSIFFKTKLCCKFRAGTCPYNSNCNFAHGMEELRKPPPGWEEMVAAQEAERAARGQCQGQGQGHGQPQNEGQAQTPGHGQGQVQGDSTGSDNARFHKTPRPCRKFYTEEGCPYGDRCIFLHDDQGSQGRVLRESNAISLGPSSLGPASNGPINVSGGGLNDRPSNWKTRVCNKWETTGHCPFGQKCHFVHGTSESFNSGSVLKNGSTGPVSVVQSQRPGQKSQVKWKGPADMISTIYGDWIEEDEWEIPPLNVVAG